MITDAKLQLSNAQAFTASGVSTNVVDLGSDRDIGRGEPMSVMVAVTTAADTTDGDEIYSFAIETDDNDSFSSPTRLTTLTVDGASLVAGYSFPVPFGKTNERYLRLAVILDGATPSVSIDAFGQPLNFVDTASDIKYPDGFDIT